MDFIYLRDHIGKGQVAVIDCTMQSNVMLTDDGNFSKFKNGSDYRYFGGLFTHFPTYVFPPSSGMLRGFLRETKPTKKGAPWDARV